MLTQMIQHQLDLGFALKPNCLLTRRPLVFLSPVRSLFFYKNPWGRIIHILFEHGYKIDLFQLPFQNIQQQKIRLNKNAAELSKKHLFMDSVTYENLKDEFSEIQMSTITVISTDPISNSNYFVFKPQDSKFSVTYWLHQKWCALQGLKTPNYNEMLSRCSESTWYQLLDHCVHLAEIDYQDDKLI